MESIPKVVKLGISACLIGERTRYDGRHKLDPFLVGTLGSYVRYTAVCPEVECGLGVPREPMRLERTGPEVSLVAVKTKRDMTQAMERSCLGLLDRLGKEELWGFVFKSRSPSCGPVVEVRGQRGRAPGVFARLWQERFPLHPAEDEVRLSRPEVREHFVRRLFVLKRWRDLTTAGMEPRGLLEFHTRHKLLILSHSEKHYREMGRLLAGAGLYRPEQLFSTYLGLLLDALARTATRSKHVNVLTHVAGYFKKKATPGEKREMDEKIAAFRAGLAPLGSPLACAGWYAGKYEISYLRDQLYVNPDPAESMLLCHS